MFQVKVHGNDGDPYVGTVLAGTTRHPFCIEGGAIVLDPNGCPIGSADPLAPTVEDAEPAPLGRLEVVEADDPDQLASIEDALEAQGYTIAI
jgi:hypothetical protein